MSIPGYPLTKIPDDAKVGDAFAVASGGLVIVIDDENSTLSNSALFIPDGQSMSICPLSAYFGSLAPISNLKISWDQEAGTVCPNKAGSKKGIKVGVESIKALGEYLDDIPF